MFPAIIGALAPIVGKVIDRAVPDQKEAQRIKTEVLSGMMEHEAAELEAKTKVLVTELSGSWLQRNWRPLLMMTIVTIIANNYLIAPYLSAVFGVGIALDLPERLWDLMTIGVGGYVAGRTGEKMVDIWKGK